MTTFISMLRGINVSGQKRVPMAELKKLYEDLGLKKVQTYIQSGNVVFECDAKSEVKLIGMIEKSIKDHFGFEVPITIRTKEEMEKVVKNTPFAAKDSEKRHVTFLREVPAKPAIEDMTKAKDPSEEFTLSGRVIYLFCPGGYGRTKLSNNFLERKTKTCATTRNWKTVTKLLEMASA